MLTGVFVWGHMPQPQPLSPSKPRGASGCRDPRQCTDSAHRKAKPPPPPARGNDNPPPPPSSPKGGRGRARGGERPMGTTAYGGTRSKGRAVSGHWPIGAASCSPEHTRASCPPPAPQPEKALYSTLQAIPPPRQDHLLQAGVPVDSSYSPRSATNRCHQWKLSRHSGWPLLH